MIKRLCCWWFGCKPDYKAADRNHTPCSRCGAHDIDYGDLVGDTRHWRAKEFLRYWLFRKWFPSKCPDCGKRTGHHADCPPF